MGSSRKTGFRIVGQFLGYELKGHKIHRVHLRCGQEECLLKVNSDVRSFLVRAYLEKKLKVGDWLEVTGVKKDCPKKGIRLKAHSLDYAKKPKGCPKESVSANPATTRVLVCQKSSCCKRGGKAVMKQLQKVVGDRHLDGQVSIRGTGCMGKCKQGPVMVIDKTHYRQVDAGKVSRLIEHHIDA